MIPVNWSHIGLCTYDGKNIKWYKKDKIHEDNVWKQLQDDGNGYPENGIPNPHSSKDLNTRTS